MAVSDPLAASPRTPGARVMGKLSRDKPMVLGIDPGLSGAIAAYDGAGLRVQDVPTLKASSRGREVDWPALADTVKGMCMWDVPSHVFIERVGAMPGQGVSSMFKFGFVAGGLRGLIAAYERPVTYVTPVAWKRALGVQKGKDASRARASELIPSGAHYWQRVKDDGRAEAALIALYGWRQLFGAQHEAGEAA